MTYSGKPFSISTYTGDQLRPDVAYFAWRNRYLVVWRGPTGGSYGTFGKLVESNAAVAPKHVEISSGVPIPSGPNSQVVGHVAVTVDDAQQRNLVVWSQGGAGPLTSDIYGCFLDGDGACLASPFRINTPADPVGYDSYIRTAWNAKTNQYLVVWQGPNDAGYQMPYGAVLDASGSVKHSVMIGDRNKGDNYLLHAVTANPNTGQWLVSFDKFCRIVDFDGTLGSLSSPPPMYNTLRVYDAFATPAGYVVIGAAPYLTNQVQVWGATLSADGKVFGSPNVLQSTAALAHARAAFVPNSKDWLAFVSLHHNVKLPVELWCRRFTTQFADVDGKPYGVIDHGDYELANGYAAHAVNTSTTETLVVWSGRYTRFETTHNFVRGVIVEMQPGLVVVQDEDNKPVPGAYVWVNDDFAGLTNASGWRRCALKSGDRIVATFLEYEHPTVKAGHDSGGTGGWAYHIWLTSADIRNDGSVFVWTVVDPRQDQVLTVRKKNTLIGFNLVACTQWSAMQSDLDQIKRFIHDASNHVYNATDGQFFVEHLTLRDNDKGWSEADIRVYSGTGRADTWNHVNMQDSYMRMYRYGQGGSVDSGDYAHELLHYVGFLPDEYEEDGPKDAVCTQKLVTESSGPFASGGRCSSCPMSGAGTHGPWKLCCSLSENPHNTKTKQGAETCWDILYRCYMNFPAWVPQYSPQYSRWQLLRPTDRQAILPGPTTLPCTGWSTVDNPTTSEPREGQALLEGHPGLRRLQFPSLASSLKNMSSAKVANDISIEVTDARGRATPADMWLELDFGVRRLGRTDANGLIRLPEATAGKTIHATSYIAQDDCVLDGKLVVGAPGRPETIILSQQQLPLSVRVQPTVSPMVLEIVIQAGGKVAQPPMVTVTPDGVRASVLVPMVLDARNSCYRGEFTSEQGNHGGGVICATVNRGTEHETVSLTEFQVVRVTGGVTPRLPSGDGYAVLALGRHTATDTIATLTRRTLPLPLSSNTELVGGPYELAATSRFIDGVIRIVPFSAFQDGDAERLRILRWQENASAWRAIPSFWHPRELYVGGGIDITDGSDPRGVYVTVRNG